MHYSLSRCCIKIGVILFTGVFFTLLFAPSVLAHAQYDHSNPAANAHLPSGHVPVHVDVWFTEHIETAFSRLEVYDKSRQRVDLNDSHMLPNDSYGLTISLRSHLPDGAYTIVFHNVSADDGHAVTGSFSFVVGSGPLPASDDALLNQLESTDENLTIWSIGLRWFNYLAMATLVGALLFFLLIWSPVLPALRKQVGPELLLAEKKVLSRIHRLLLVSLLALLAVQIAYLLYQTSLASTSTLWQILSGALSAMLFQSRFGQLWQIRFVLLLASFFIWFVFSRRNAVSSHSYWLLILIGCSIMLTTSLDAHAAANPLAWLLVPSDVLHLISTALWIGGLFTLVLVLPPVIRCLVPGTGDRTRLLAGLLPRFTPIALVSVALLLLTGTLQALVQFHVFSGTPGEAFHALTATAYGRTLLVKLLLFVLLLGFGAFHMLVVSRRLQTFVRTDDEEYGASSFAAGHLQRTFQKTIKSEALVAIGLLLVVGVLTSLSPPPAQPTAAARGSGIFQGTMADMNYTLVINPGKVGSNTFEVALINQHGQPIRQTDAVLLYFVMLDMDMGVQELQLDPVKNSPGHYHASADMLSMSGHWQITLLVRRPSFEDTRTILTYSLAP